MAISRSGGGWGPPAAQAVAYSTTFPATENPISQGAIWTNGAADGTSWNNVRTTTAKAFASSLSGTGATQYDDCIAHLKSSFISFSGNQFVEGVIYIAGGYAPGVGNDHEIELLGRFDITSGNARGYEVYWGLTNGGYLNITCWNGGLGSFTVLSTQAQSAPTNGDVLRAEFVGTVITVKINGVTKTTYDTASDVTKWSTGQPGVGMYVLASATLANYGFSSYSAGNL